jgi:TPR repeat protein
MQTPLDSEKRAIPLCNLSIGLLTRYNQAGELADLEEGIQHLQEALSLLPPTSPNRPACLMNLGIGLISRYSHTGQLADLEQSIQLLYEALSLLPPTSPNRPACLINLGIVLSNRYSHTGQLADLEQAIQYYQEALDLLSTKSSTRRSCLYNLGQVLVIRYDNTGSLADLEQAIQLWYEALALTPTNSELSVNPLNSLSRGLRRLYKHRGKLTDLEQAIQLLSEAFSLISPSSPYRASLLNSLGMTLSERYDLTREQADLDKALQCYNQALSLEPLDSHTRNYLLTNLGVALYTQYILTGKLTDLEQAIQLWQRVVDEVPTSEPMRVVYVANLAMGLDTLYELTGELDNLDRALLLYNQAINVTSLNSPDRTRYLNNLGSGWRSRYSHTGDLVDLEQAINNFQQAVDEALPNLSDRTAYLSNLEAVLFTYYLHTQKREYLDRAISVLEQAWSSLHTTFITLPVFYKIGQQKQWFRFYVNLISDYLRLATIDRTKAVVCRRRALEVAESAKSRLLTQLVGRGALSSPNDIRPEIIAREKTLLTELTSLDNAELTSYGHMTIDEWGTDRTRSLHQREKSLQELEHLWTTISKISPRGYDYVALRRGDAPTWADLIHLANSLGNRTALLSFFITPQRIRFFILRKGWRGPRVVDISLHESRWIDLLVRFSHEIPFSGGSNRRGETWDQPLQELLKMASKHLAGVNRLILTPQGAGHLLPWSVVLQRTGYRTSEGLPLPLVTLPALGLLPRLRQRPRSLDGPALVIGNPRGDLPFTEQEAQAVAAQFGVTPLIGSQATKSVVLAQLEQASLIHLATHAFFVPGAPLEAAIELADDELTAREVLQLRLQADLLVLSGCETGKAETLGGEELAGLAQAFLQTGVRSLLVSLWPVNDLATAALMQAFYTARQAGADKALALRQAMTQIQQDPRWSHPYYWGAFVLVGDWN